MFLITTTDGKSHKIDSSSDSLAGHLVGMGYGADEVSNVTTDEKFHLEDEAIILCVKQLFKAGVIGTYLAIDLKNDVFLIPMPSAFGLIEFQVSNGPMNNRSFSNDFFSYVEARKHFDAIAEIGWEAVRWQRRNQAADLFLTDGDNVYFFPQGWVDSWLVKNGMTGGIDNEDGPEIYGYAPTDTEPNSAVDTMFVPISDLDKLREIDEAKARKIHPYLFECLKIIGHS